MFFIFHIYIETVYNFLFKNLSNNLEMELNDSTFTLNYWDNVDRFLKTIVLHCNYEFLVQDTHHPLRSIRFKKRDGAVKHGRLE